MMTTQQDTIKQAADNWDAGPDGYSLTDAVCECFNCHRADLTDDGNVWIDRPQSSHWLSTDELSTLIDWLAVRKMI